MQKIKHGRCCFGEFVLDITRWCLLRGSEEVKLRPKSFEVLKYLVENHGRLVTKSELIETVWPDTFVTDNSLVQCLIEVRRALEDHRQQIIKTVPRRGYVFVADVRKDDPQMGAPEADEENIVFEETDNLKDEKPVIPPPRPSEPAKSRRVLLLASILCAVVVTTGLTIFFRHRAPGPRVSASPIGSLAVMPLKNLTNDPETDYFADGLTESLIMSLSKLNGLKVISRGSVFSFKGRDIDPRDVGKQLGVAAVLEGSVKRTEGSVRVTVSLVSAEDGRVLWASEKYERALHDIFALEGEIAGTIASELRVKLNPEKAEALARQYTANLDAYELYLKGRFVWNKRTPEALIKGVGYFEQARARDPNFALAYVGLADCYVLLPEYRVMLPNEAFSKARIAATRALEIDDQLAEAHTSLAYTLAFYDWDWAGAEKEFKRAIALNPNYATAHQWYAEYLALGRPDESLTEYRRAEELDPLSLIIKADIAGHFYLTRQFDRAIEESHRIIELDPNFAWGYGFLWLSSKEKGLFQESLEALLKSDELFGESRANLGAQRAAYARSGWKGYWQTRLKQANEPARRGYVQAIDRAIIYVELGDKERAIESLEQSYAARERWIVTIKVAPQFEGLRSDPRFQELLRRMNLTS